MKSTWMVRISAIVLGAIISAGLAGAVFADTPTPLVWVPGTTNHGWQAIGANTATDFNQNPILSWGVTPAATTSLRVDNGAGTAGLTTTPATGTLNIKGVQFPLNVATTAATSDQSLVAGSFRPVATTTLTPTQSPAKFLVSANASCKSGGIVDTFAYTLTNATASTTIASGISTGTQTVFSAAQTAMAGTTTAQTFTLQVKETAASGSCPAAGSGYPSDVAITAIQIG